MYYKVLAGTLLLFSQSSSAQDFKRFINQYQSSHPERKTDELELKGAQLGYHASKQPSQINILGETGYTRGQQGDEDSYDSKSELKYSPLIGTTFGATYLESASQDVFGNSVRHSRSFLNIQQSILRNGFGRGQELEESESEFELAHTREQKTKNELDRCLDGANLYTQLYYQEGRLKVTERLLKEAEKIENITKRQYREKLVDRLTLLSAKANRLKSDNLLQQEKNEMKRLVSVSRNRLEGEYSHQENPEKYFLRQKLGDEPSLLERSLVRKRDLEKVRLAKTREGVRPKLDVSIEFGKNTYLGYEVDPGFGDYVMAGVNYEIPVYTPSQKLKVVAQKNHVDTVTARLIAASMDRKALKEELVAKIESIHALRKLTEKSIKIYEELNVESNHQYKNGKIEFEVLRDYQNRLLQELLLAGDLMKSEWDILIDSFRLSSQLPDFCMGI